MTSPILLDLVGYFLSSNIVDKYAIKLRKECRARQLMAISKIRPWLSAVQTNTTSPQPHLWVSMPEGVNAFDFARQAAKENVLVVASDSFNMSKREPLQAVRICLMGVENRALLDKGLDIILRLLGQGAVPAIVMP